MVQSKKLFSKSLTKTDINKRMAIPAKILSSLPDFKGGNHAVTIRLRCGTGEWPVACTIRKKGYKKPVFSSGWRKFVVCNNFDVGDKLTLLEVKDKAGSFHYEVQVEKPARPSGGLLPAPFPLDHELDETTGKSCTKASNFQNEQQQLLKADAPIKQEKAITELTDVATDVPVAFVDNLIAKPANRIFGSDVSADNATRRAHFVTEEESKKKYFGIAKSICMGEPPVNSYYMTNEQREINFFALAEDSAMAYGTSQAVGYASYKSRTERLNSDLILGLPTPYKAELSLVLTLAPPIVDGGHETKESQNSSPKRESY